MNNWEKLSDQEKKEAVDKIFAKDIRPMISQHGGDVTVLDVKGNEIFISYHGACAGCAAALSSTLQFIENAVREKMGDQITVTPVF